MSNWDLQIHKLHVKMFDTICISRQYFALDVHWLKLTIGTTYDTSQCCLTCKVDLVPIGRSTHE